MHPPTKKIKILRIIARLNIGGPSIHVIKLTHYLQNDDFESVLVAGKEGEHEGNMLHLAEEKDVTPIFLPELGRELHPLKDLKTLWQLYQIIKREKPDIVHTHTAKAGTLGRIAARMAGVKRVYHTFHGHVLHSYFGRLKTAIFRWIERMLGLLTTKIIVISEQQKRELVSLKIAPEKKFVVIPLGFELAKFKNLKRTNHLHKKMNLPEATKLVGIIGRLAPIKNHELLIPIMNEIKKQRADIKIIVIGSGELEAQLRHKFSAAGLAEDILFYGWEQDLTKIYPNLDVVILTSLNEGTPVAIIEAMACGTPVISTKVGGVEDIIGQDRGFLETKEDIKKFAQDIITLTHDVALRRSFIEKGKQYVYSTYTIDRLVNDLKKLYKTPQ